VRGRRSNPKLCGLGAIAAHVLIISFFYIELLHIYELQVYIHIQVTLIYIFLFVNLVCA